jgi:predicted phage terminase large subunit-like protein
MDLELAYALARKDFRTFFGITSPGANYVYGRHTREFISQCQAATEAIERGENYYVILNVPPRHGKSDVVSRRYPVWHLGDHPDHEIILASYGADLATELSGNAKECFKACVDAKMFWDLKISNETHKKNSWGINQHKGLMNAVGLGGTINGRGAHVLVIDDYCKNREEAESLAKRDRAWNSFQSDLLTRLSPEGHAVLIVATRWHPDDLTGRIIEAMAADPKFPRFKIISMPAWNETTEQWLFPERFSPENYEAFRAAVGSYAWQSLYQQDPKPRTGNMLRVDKVHVIKEKDLPPGLVWRRSWDLASTKKERAKDDPDWTVGTLSAWDPKKRRIYVRDVIRGQWGPMKREDMIVKTAAADRLMGVSEVVIEGVGGYVDAVKRIKTLLRGIMKVVKVRPQSDKVARATETIDPIFDAGHVYIVRDEWNSAWLDEFAAFPAGKHDDQVDSLIIGVYDRMKRIVNRIREIEVWGI